MVDEAGGLSQAIDPRPSSSDFPGTFFSISMAKSDFLLPCFTLLRDLEAAASAAAAAAAAASFCLCTTKGVVKKRNKVSAKIGGPCWIELN